MKKLLICCIYGATAGSLAKKMQAVADRRGYQLMISAIGIENFASVAPAFDCYLFAPHIQYKLSELTQNLRPGCPVAVIESYPYASLDGEKVFDYAIAHLPVLVK
ncbi:PTS cellobiose transporter subunit IIB [Superficieibacter electus]|uniref:PTS cellobiose transporter subunit IIB n=1 Tax=Superficieibacter electus TaxID=2022662 RepID=A0A2P5GNT2_9ENTR|nr:PTS cellobiose transporter subunit IIB [Superficieibacter electus]POP44838.1 PTS cellobiose transporter subunit IIB [Superficieibacter electus]POP48225.1 PTS cellobiose transporter subunit IIB [Superficieibacter electus]